jgi:uncharacterized membrane protein
MPHALLAAFILGIVSGLRVFTAPAVLLLTRRGGIIGIILGILALVEYALDIMPKTPPRTGLTGLNARIISGAFVGFWVTFTQGGSTAHNVVGGVIGIVGALIGAFGGLNLRMRAIPAIGGVASGIVEDLIAIAIAFGAVAIA